MLLVTNVTDTIHFHFLKKILHNYILKKNINKERL